MDSTDNNVRRVGAKEIPLIKRQTNEEVSTSKVNGLPSGENQREQSHAIKAGIARRCVWKD